MKKIKISLDAMGGDNAPEIVVEGAAEAKLRYPDIEFIFFGNKTILNPLIISKNNLCQSEIIHTVEFIRPNDKPSNVIRRGANTSMALAVKSVKNQSNAMVSAGNTGALMAFSKLFLKTISGINRPAIAACFPTKQGEVCMLDLGANIECDKDNLIQFALMGQAFAKIVIGIKNPRVCLLNVGEEEIKGFSYIKEASETLKSLRKIINYRGYVEGDRITDGLVDVIVTDGFTGNIALKTAEGTASFFASSLKQSLKKSIFSKIGYFLAKKSLEGFRAHMDPRKYNGAVFLGLNGIAVKSHGGTDSFGFANAIGVAYDMAKYDFIEDLKKKLSITTKHLHL
ncbi:phosphate acyltransferase PlsX [Alphaproteobacteria bacterium]|nr:phosphate acyltransferase PlsX [Alphaproteobacteria bacterium]